MAESGGEEGLADADGAYDHDVVAGFDETQRAERVPGAVIEGDGRRVVSGLEDHAGSRPGRRLRRCLVVDLVGEEQFEEPGVAEEAGPGQGRRD